MSPKKIKLKNFTGLKKIKTLIPKGVELKKISFSPSNVIEKTRIKLNKYYEDLKKNKEKERKKF